ncbi:hypothetical protein MBANPS3_007401 [Mucor bainieri]
MKLKSVALWSSLITASVVVAQIEEIEDQLWNDESSSWEDVHPPETTDILESGPVYETVTITTTWVPPDINQWAYPEEYFAKTTTEYDTEEEAEMALERNGEKKKHFRRKKKHFKKKSHHKMMKPQAYLDQQSSAVPASNVNADVMSLQKGDVVIEKWEDQFGNVVAASVYSYKSESSSGEEITDKWTELVLPSASVETIETPFPKVLLNDQANVDAASSGASTTKNTMSWAMVSIAAVYYVFFS